MRIFKTKFFAKIAKLEGLSDKALTKAIDEVRKGLIDAALGGNLVKKRIAVGSKGKSGGLRSILVYKASITRVFCVYLFPKNETDNISQKQLDELKLLGKTLFRMTETELTRALENRVLQEVIQGEE